MPKKPFWKYAVDDLVTWNEFRMRDLVNYWKVMTKVQRAELLKEEGLDFCLTAGIRPKDEILEMAGIDLAQLDERRTKILRSPVPKERPYPDSIKSWTPWKMMGLPYYRKYLPEMWFRVSAVHQIEFLSKVGLEPCLEVGIRPADKILREAGIDPKSVNWPEAPTVQPAKWEEISAALQAAISDLLRWTWEYRTDAEIVEFIKTYGYEICSRQAITFKDKHLIRAGLNPEELNLYDMWTTSLRSGELVEPSYDCVYASYRWEDEADLEGRLEYLPKVYPKIWGTLDHRNRLRVLLHGGLSYCRKAGIRPSDELLREAGIDLEFVDWEDTTGLDQ